MAKLTEQHCLSDFVRRIETDSEIIPGKKIHRHILTCPVCGKENPLPEPWVTEKCGNCGAEWRTQGNLLHLTVERDRT